MGRFAGFFLPSLLLLLVKFDGDVFARDFDYFSAEGDWNYDPNSEHGPGNWVDEFPTCGGKAQSPIDIITTQVSYMSELSEFSYNNYAVPEAQKFMLQNTGKSIQINIGSQEIASAISISGGNLSEKYILEQFHFHWGPNSNEGSEHTIDGKACAMEIHLVHWKQSYNNFTNAQNYYDGLAVLGILVQVQSDPTPASGVLANLTKHFHEIMYPDEVDVPSFDLNLLLPSPRTYHRYQGSLTTPGCNEIVTWTVYNAPIYVTEKEVAEFRKVFTSDNTTMVTNFRPVQDLSGRKVYTNLVSGQTTVKPLWTTVFATLLIVLVAGSFK